MVGGCEYVDEQLAMGSPNALEFYPRPATPHPKI
jgi:hypothetical protein